MNDLFYLNVLLSLNTSLFCILEKFQSLLQLYQFSFQVQLEIGGEKTQNKTDKQASSAGFALYIFSRFPQSIYFNDHLHGMKMR